MHIGEFYGLWMKANGLTQADVVRETKLRSSQVSHFVKGRTFLSTTNLLKLTKLAGISVEELYASAQNNKPPRETETKKREKKQTKKRKGVK